MVKKEYYEILGIEENATESDIRKAYIKLARATHPDRGGKGEEFKKVNKAYEILIDESKRKAYDNGQDVSVEKYGYDYNEEVPIAEDALARAMDGMSFVYWKLSNFFAYYETYKREAEERGEELPIVSDYYLIRAKKILQALMSYKKVFNGNSQKFNWEVGHKDGFQWWNGQVDWEQNVRNFKSLVDFAREKIGLKKLTDQDLQLQIEGNNQNEIPKIPDNNEPDKLNGNQEPPKIKDGVANIDEYNNLYYDRNHETIRKYDELRGIIYNTPESLAKYSAVNSTLYKEMDAKAIEAERGSFRKIWVNDDENKISETKKFNESKLEKMKGAIKSMEKLIEEGKSYQPKSGDKKRKADEFETRQEVAKKSKTTGEELSRLIREVQELTNYQELEAKIKEIDKYQGEASYEKQYREEINQLKIRLGSLDKDKYREGIVKKIEKELSGSGLKENDLDQETKNDLAKLKSGEIKDVSKINEIENKIASKSGEKKSTDNLNKWLEQAKKLVDGIIKGSADYLEKELKKIKRGLYEFQLSDNEYQNKAYQSKEKAVNAMLNKLENYSVQNNAAQPSRGFFRPEIIIPVSLLVVAIVAAIVALVRRRNRVKVK